MLRPDVFGKYQLLSQIASGGMAEVWLARSSSVGGFEKLLAIKRIRSSLCDNRAFVSMFIAEAKLTVCLSHPNIVQVFDFGKVDDDYYMAMEYVEGADLSRIARQARKRGHALPVGTSIYILNQVMEGLAYAHSRPTGPGHVGPIIHRDISPQNILVSFDGHVKVNDFGIAKAVHEAEPNRGEIFGKLAYVSPEQCGGEPADVTTDIWSAGVVLHELLTNQRLFARNTDAATMLAVEKMPVPRPSDANPAVPAELDDLVISALDRDPQRRLQTAREIAQQLALIQSQRFPTQTAFHLQEVIGSLWDGQLPRVLPAPELDPIADTRAPRSQQDGASISSGGVPPSQPLAPDSVAVAAETAARQLRHVRQDSEWNQPLEPTVASRPRREPKPRFDSQHPTLLDLRPPVVVRQLAPASTDTELKRLKRLFMADPNLWVLVDIGRRYRRLGRSAQAVGALKLAAAKFAQGGLLVQAACIYREIIDGWSSTDSLREDIRRLPSLQGQSNTDLLVKVFDAKDALADFTDFHSVFERDTRSIEVFHESPILSSLNAEQFLGFVEAVALRCYTRGSTIIAEGAAGDSFYLLGRGRVVVSTKNFQGRKVYMTSLSDGDCFGEHSYFSGEPRNATVEALENAVVLEVSKQVLNRVTQEFPTVRESLRRFYKERIAEGLLAKSPLFGHLHIRARRELAERFTFETYAEGDLVIREGDYSDAFYAIKSGTVLVYAGGDQHPVVLAELGPGEIFGEIAALAGTQRTATIRTTTACELLRLEAAELNALLAKNVDIRRRMERTIAERNLGRQSRLDPTEL